MKNLRWWWDRLIGWFYQSYPGAEPVQTRELKQPELTDTAPPVLEPADQPEPKPIPEEPVVKQTRDTTMLHLRRDVAKAALAILERLENLGRSRNEAHEDWYNYRILSNLWDCDFHLVDSELIDRMAGGDRWSILEPQGIENEVADAVWPIDLAVALQYEDRVDLVRMTTIRPQDVRGQLRLVLPKSVVMHWGHFHNSGRWSVHEAFLGLAGTNWVLADEEMKHFTSRAKFKRWQARSAALITSHALSARYQWHVAFGIEKDGPRLLLPTNPGACLELFKNRDKAAGKSRRDMLKHWVEEHYRETSSTGIAYVAAHLRGHTTFDWSGFGCELFVSEFDLEKNEFFKKQAAEWRSRRQHNAVRIKSFKRKMEQRPTA